MAKKSKLKKRKTKRAIRQRLDALERTLAARETERLPSPEEQREESDKIREGLRARLAQGPQPGLKQKTRGDDPLLLELLARFEKLSEGARAREKLQREEDRDAYWAAVRRRWNIIAGVQEEPDIIPTVAAISEKPKSDSIAAGFSSANRGGYESDDYSNVKGMSEGELWAWQARHLPSE